MPHFFLGVDTIDKDTLIVLDKILNWLLHGAIELAQRLVVAVIVFVVLSWLIKWVRKGVHLFLTRRKIDDTVKVFLDSVVNIALQLVLVLSVVSIIGISTTSFTAILAAVGLAVGMAMKDNLANFAGGVMLLVNKPFKNGDRILAQNVDGVVQAIGILYTTILTADNRTVYIPNGPLSTGTISNYSRQRTRRIDKTIIIKHGVDIDDIKTSIHNLLEQDARILKKPVPFIGVSNMTSTTIDLTIRIWVNHEEYDDVTIDLNEEIYADLMKKQVYKNTL